MKFNLLIIDRFQENVFGFVCSIKLEVEHSKKVRVRKMFQCQVTSPLIRIFSVAEMNRGGRGQLAPAPAAASTLIFDLGTRGIWLFTFPRHSGCPVLFTCARNNKSAALSEVIWINTFIFVINVLSSCPKSWWSLMQWMKLDFKKIIW